MSDSQSKKYKRLSEEDDAELEESRRKFVVVCAFRSHLNLLILSGGGEI